MPKLKTHKASKKRMSVTATGKVMRTKAGSSHLMSGKSAKKKRSMRRKGLVVGKQVKAIREALG